MPETYRGRRISAVWNTRQLHFDLRIAGKYVLWYTPTSGIFSKGIGRDPVQKAAALDMLRKWIDMADERGPDAFEAKWFVGAPKSAQVSPDGA